MHSRRGSCRYWSRVVTDLYHSPDPPDEKQIKESGKRTGGEGGDEGVTTSRMSRRSIPGFVERGQGTDGPSRTSLLDRVVKELTDGSTEVVMGRGQSIARGGTPHPEVPGLVLPCPSRGDPLTREERKVSFGQNTTRPVVEARPTPCPGPQGHVRSMGWDCEVG